ncbi:MAG: hypothetical protein NWF06_11230 [Candidatus Bathyarchaeota archaeon]|nr:hypothetical protein [Candidatus Bathyarchaeum sp.]
MNTKHFEKWAKGKHPLIAMVAYGQASQAKIAYGIAKAIHEEDMFLGDFTTPDLNTWLKLFRSHKNGIEFINQFLGTQSSIIRSIESVTDQLDDNAPIKASNISTDAAKSLLEKTLKTINMSEEEMAQNYQPQELEQFLRSPDFYFFFRVYVPCQLFHYTTPAQLLRKARQRNFDSLIKLIKLDHSVIFDRKVSRYIHELRSTRRSKYEQIIDTLHFKSRGQITKQKFKVFYAAMIMNMANELGEKLTAPEIRELFDAIYQDEGKGLIDPDLPGTPHSFYMAIKRHIANSK